MKPRDKIDRHANLSEISARIKYDPLWKSQHLISLNLKQLCLMFYLVKVFCSVQYDPRRKSQHLVSLDLKPLVLTFYLMIVFCSELSLQSRLCSAVANSKDRSHQSLVCRIKSPRLSPRMFLFQENNAMSKNRSNNFNARARLNK